MQLVQYHIPKLCAKKVRNIVRPNSKIALLGRSEM